MNESYMDAAAVPVPDAGDDTLREQLARIIKMQIVSGHPDAVRPLPLADALLPLVREHTERAAEQARAYERERMHQRITDLQEEYGKREESQDRIRDRLGSELAAVRAQNRVLHERLNRVRRLCTLTLDSVRIHAREMAEDVLRILDGGEIP